MWLRAVRHAFFALFPEVVLDRHLQLQPPCCHDAAKCASCNLLHMEALWLSGGLQALQVAEAVAQSIYARSILGICCAAFC